MNTNISNAQNIYLFIDTNLYYSNRNTYEFENWDIKEIIQIRDQFNHIFWGNKEMILLSPDMVLKEVHSTKKERLVRDFNKFLKSIKRLGEDQLTIDIKQIIDKFDDKLNDEKKKFISSERIIVPSNCSNEYLDNIVEKAINKKIPFKPKYDSKKECFVGDNGFKDAVIWYSIVDYVKNKVTVEDSHIILLTNNKSDFNSEELLDEFNKITGKNIEIYAKDKKEFSNFILNEYAYTKIERIHISYVEINNNIILNYIKVLPLMYNMHSSFPKCIDSIMFKDKIENVIAAELKKFGFSVKDLKFEYTIPNLEYVNVELRNYKFWFLDILDLELNYDDGSTVYADDPEDINFSTMLGEIDEYEKSFKNKISSYLEEQGYGTIDPNIIDYEIVEFIPPGDY